MNDKILFIVVISICLLINKHFENERFKKTKEKFITDLYDWNRNR